MRVLGRTINMSEVSRRTGISTSQISRIFRGERDPSYHSLIALAADIGISLDDLVAYLQEKSNNGSTTID
jgi:transcriptional regulator with XRE-family HTH domain